MTRVNYVPFGTVPYLSYLSLGGADSIASILGRAAIAILIVQAVVLYFDMIAMRAIGLYYHHLQ